MSTNSGRRRNTGRNTNTSNTGTTGTTGSGLRSGRQHSAYGAGAGSDDDGANDAEEVKYTTPRANSIRRNNTTGHTGGAPITNAGTGNVTANASNVTTPNPGRGYETNTHAWTTAATSGSMTTANDSAGAGSTVPMGTINVSGTVFDGFQLNGNQPFNAAPRSSGRSVGGDNSTVSTNNGDIKPKNITISNIVKLTNSNNFPTFKAQFLTQAKMGGYYDYLTTPPEQHWQNLRIRYGHCINAGSLYGWYRDNHQRITGSIQFAVSELIPNFGGIATEIDTTHATVTTDVIDPDIGGAFADDNAYLTWQKVLSMYEKRSLHNVKVLLDQMFSLQCNAGTDVNTFITNFNSIWSKLNELLRNEKRSGGNILPDALQVVLMTRCLSKTFEHIPAILESTGTLTPLNLETHLRLQYAQKHPTGVLLVPDSSKRSAATDDAAHSAVDTPTRRGGGGTGTAKHGRFRRRNGGGTTGYRNSGTDNGATHTSQEEVYEFGDITARADLAIGHECTGTWSDDSDDESCTGNGGDSTDVSGTDTGYAVDDAFQSMWTLKLDSGATRHIIANPKLFIKSSKPPFVHTVHGLMNTKGTVSAVGSIRLTQNIIIHNVWYIKNAGANLISLGRLLEDGAGFNVTNDGVEMLDKVKGKRIGFFKFTNGLFLVTHPSAPKRQIGYQNKRDIEYKQPAPRQRGPPAPPLRKIPKKDSKRNAPAGGTSTGNAGASTNSASTNAREALQQARKANAAKASTAAYANTGRPNDEAYFVNAASANAIDPCMDLHVRLGHATITKDVAIAVGIPYTTPVTVKDCTACLLAKTTRKATGTGTYTRPTSPFEKVSVDLMGPISLITASKAERLSSLGGSTYIMVIMDEYSRYVWIHLLKSKADAAAKLVSFVTMIKTQYNTTVKRIHSDGGTEFNNHYLSQFYDTNGIIATFTTAGTPAHNGGVERMNRTIKSMVTTMLLHSSTSVTLWGEAAVYAGYVHNRTPIRALQYKTPYEFLNGVTSSIDKVHVFGTDVIVNTTATTRHGKFQAPNVQGIFVGISETKNALRVLVADNRIIVSRDVKILTTLKHQAIINAASTDANDALHIIFDDPDGGQEVEVTEPQSILPSNTGTNRVTHIEEPPLPDIDDDYESPLSPIMEEDEIEAKYDSSDDTNMTSNGNGNDVTALDINTSRTRIGRTIRPISRYGQIDLRDLEPLSRRQVTGGAYGFYVRTTDTLELVTDNTDVAYGVIDTTTVNIVDPVCYKQAVNSVNAADWCAAMKTEKEALEHQSVLIPPVPPSNTKLLKTRWVYKTKTDEHNRVIKRKARLVVKGYTQEAGIDFFETFAPVSKGKTLKLFLSLAAQFRCKLKQLDFKNAFLNAGLPEDIYIACPEGFNSSGVTAYKLNKSLYGLKQAPFLWYSTIHKLLIKLGYTNTISDMCTYYKQVPNSNIPIIISLYVDDMIILVPPLAEAIWDADKKQIRGTYDIDDIGDCKWILKVLVTRDDATGTITLSQQAYVEAIVAKYYSTDVNAGTTANPCMVSYDLSEPDTITKYGATTLTEIEQLQYMSLVGALGYLANTTRIDIAYAVNMLQRNIANATTVHMKCAINVVKYLKGTANYGLVFKPSADGTPFQITGYSDADYAGDKSTRKSTSGSVIKFNGNVVAWSSKKQSTVALSTMESEYVALVNTATDMLWIRSWLQEVLPTSTIPPMLMWCDNQSTVHILGKDDHHATTKHMDVKLHFIRDNINNGGIEVKWITTVDQVADVLTKCVSTARFKQLVNKLVRAVIA